MNVLGSDLLDMDLLIIMMSYLFLSYGTIAAVGFAFGQGLLVDIFSGGLHGLFTTLYLVLFAWIYLGSRIFNPRDPKGQAIIHIPQAMHRSGSTTIALVFSSLDKAPIGQTSVQRGLAH